MFQVISSSFCSFIIIGKGEKNINSVISKEQIYHCMSFTALLLLLLLLTSLSVVVVDH